MLCKMEHLLQKSKCSIYHNIFKYMIFQRRQKVLLWSKGLIAPNSYVFADLLVISFLDMFTLFSSNNFLEYRAGF